MTGRLSSSSSFNYQWTYDVFLNFRGEDTRHGFVGNLFDALRRKGIHTFMDDGELRKGDEITPSLFKAIEQSRMAITVFSKNYASSTFCLAELDKILQHIKRNGRLVWPIFYGVKPSDVRYLKGNYEKALSMHQNNFKANEETVQSWKLALREAACLSGSHFNPGHEYEYQFIQKIVSEISSKINITPLYIAKNPIGLESRVPKIVSLLQIDSHDEVIMLGIYGIGGIGKSTIARAVFNSIADQFEGLCFLDDIKQGSSKHGIKKKQERMLKNTLEVNIKVEDVNQGISIIKRRLNQKKILLVLDNVDKQEQLENIAGNCDWFGPGSRIIITTRDKHLLAIHGVEKLYEVKELNNEESLELLSWNAFKNNQVDPSYVEVLNCVVKYTKGLPLALKVIGSHLSGKSIEEWKSAIDIYKRNPNKEVHGILKVSYDGLEEVVQEIFLDIACFFKGKDMKYVKDMIQNVRGFDPTYCIGVLMDKCLINYGYDYVVMHDLIQDMGREIIHQESPNEPGKRSRLWNNEDIAHVLENNTGTNTIVMIQDNLSQDIKVNWNGKALKKMKNLKMLMFTNTYFSEGPKYLPNSLRVLKWLKYPSSSLPGHFHPTKLAILDLNQGELQSLEPFKMGNLSVLNLSNCFSIKQIPDVSGIPNLIEFHLGHCKNLIEIHESVGNLGKLQILSVELCENLRTFPHGIKLPSLKYLHLWGCSSLEKFPEILEKMEYIRQLNLSETAIEKLPFSIRNLIQLDWLVMKGCRGVGIQLPSSIAMLPKLGGMFIEGCREVQSSKQDEGQEEVISMLCSNMKSIALKECNISDEFLPVCLTWFANVKYLDLSSNNFTFLPAHIKECRFLVELILDDCKHLREIRGIPPNMHQLSAINCTSLNSESTNILLSQELHEAGDTEFCVPGARIPELFESCRGPSIYFKFCNKYPAISLCLFIPRNKSVCRKFLWAQVIVNDQEIFKGNIWDTELSLLADHIFIYDLRRAYNNMDHVLLENSWNSMEVRIYKEGYSFPYDIGINVIKAESRKEDIQFNDPYKRRKIESLKWDSVFMASSCGYASDEDLQQPQDLNRRNLTLDPMEWEYPAEMLEDRLDLNDQAGTTCDKGLQQQQHLIPKSSGNENVRKVKGKDKMVCRRKKRRIH